MKAIVVNKETGLTELRAKGETVASGLMERLVASHDTHEGTLQNTVDALERLGWQSEIVQVAEFDGPSGHDLVVSVGGDGTVLAASHQTFDVPLVGINSDPERSVGYFCATAAAGVLDVLTAFETGQLPAFELHRLRIQVDGETVGVPVLNEVLVVNENPAATSRYALIAGTRVEHHRSSGIWISTPAGSTAGIRSAGGAVLPLEVPLLQYLVREPVVSLMIHYELQRGVRELTEGITVVSEIRGGYAYIDGPYEGIRLGLGARMHVSAHVPLTIMGLEPARRER